MSNPGTSGTPTSLSITGNPAIDGLILKGILAIAAAATGVILTWLNAHGFNDPNLNLMVSGVIVSILAMGVTALWGWMNSKIAQAKAVTAGINLGLSGNSINVRSGDGTVTPLPVSTSAADRIVKEFGSVKVSIPDEPALTNVLNQTQIVQK